MERASAHDRYHRIIRSVIPDVEFHQNRYARELGEVATRGCRWLDLGAGTRLHGGWIGPERRELAEISGFLVGCDLLAEHLASNDSLDAAAVAGAERLPFRDGAFDLVTANMLLEHLANPEPVFQEVHRILAPGGHFLFLTPNRHDPIVWLSDFLLPRRARSALAHRLEERDEEHIFETHYRANTPRRLRALGRKAGFDPCRVAVFRSYPVLRRPWPATLLEALWLRLARLRPLRGLGSNIVGRLRKPGRPSAHVVSRGTDA